jgi:hypothetical protein
MSRYKDHLLDWEQRVHEIDNYYAILTTAETQSEVVNHIVEQLDLTYETDISHVSEIVSDDWNEYWSKYL